MIYPSTDEHFMQRALKLAQNGLGNVAPNPMVGSVIVYEGKIMGEGYHQKFGSNHAEINAIEQVKNKALLSKSTLYVTLEPCNHQGKTPPCTDAIIQHKIPKVVIASVDENPLVKNKGIQRLIDAGVEVKVGVCKQDADFLNRRFFAFHTHKRPYIILKWAESKDGYINKLVNDKSLQVKISNNQSHILSHKWRTEEQAIMIGTNTAIIDNPQLNARLWPGKNPLRILIDRSFNVPSTHHLLADSGKTLIFHQSKKKAVKSNNKEYIFISGPFIESIFNILYERGVQSILVEGGAITHQFLIEHNLWDEARVFKSEQVLETGIQAPTIPAIPNEKKQIGSDSLSYYYR